MGHLFQQGFFVRKPAWHELGVVVDEYPGLEPAMKLAGHDHGVEEIPIGLLYPGVTTLPAALQDYKALVRNDTKQVLSVMKKSYKTIQNRLPWEMLDSLFMQGAKWDTAGILSGRYDENNKEIHGQVYWCMCLLDEPQMVKGDVSLTYPYMLSTWSHDGSQALHFCNTDVRVVCANTQRLAMFGSRSMDLDVSIRHYGELEKRVEKAKEIINNSRKAHQVYMDAANELAAVSVTDQQIEQFIFTVIPLRENSDGIVTDRVRNNVEKDRQKMRDIFNSPTMTGGTVRNTVYGLVAAGTEYFQHVRRCVNKDVYFTRSTIKPPVQMNYLVHTAKEIAGMSI